jgi:hypothetical protein
MLTSPEIADIAHVVQMAVAPVFLLTGVGSILAVLTTRMGRVIDRAHRIDGWIEDGKDPTNYARELDSLRNRLKIIHQAITLCSLSAFCVCAVVFTIFVGTYADVRIGGAVAFLFAAAMVMLIGALGLFVLEVQIARRSIMIGPKTL